MHTGRAQKHKSSKAAKQWSAAAHKSSRGQSALHESQSQAFPMRGPHVNEPLPQSLYIPCKHNLCIFSANTIFVYSPQTQSLYIPCKHSFCIFPANTINWKCKIHCVLNAVCVYKRIFRHRNCLSDILSSLTSFATSRLH